MQGVRQGSVPGETIGPRRTGRTAHSGYAGQDTSQHDNSVYSSLFLRHVPSRSDHAPRDADPGPRRPVHAARSDKPPAPSTHSLRKHIMRTRLLGGLIGLGLAAFFVGGFGPATVPSTGFTGSTLQAQDDPMPTKVPVLVLWRCLLYTSPSPRDGLLSRMPSSA